LNDYENYDFWSYTVQIVSGANMASTENIQGSIRELEALIGTGYYDDDAGDILMKQVIEYLKGKIKNAEK
jgi:hypothetical protein